MLDLMRTMSLEDEMSASLESLRTMARHLDAESALFALEIVEDALRAKIRAGVSVVAQAIEVVASVVENAIGAHPAPTMFLESYDTPRVVNGKTLSRYQANILEFVEHHEGDGIVGAVAGSGKTTTLVMLANIINVPALFVAFNKDIAAELRTRLAGTKMTAKTIHSVGLGALIKAYGPMGQPSDLKYTRLAENEVQSILPPTKRLDRNAVNATKRMLKKLVDFSRLTLTDPSDRDAMMAMAERYNVDVPSNGTDEDERLIGLLFEAVGRMLDEGKKLATGPAHAIDFTDMVWLPYALNLTPAQSAWVMVDECQDLNRAQLELVLKLRAPKGRMLFVGDSRQAIYGFAGADSNSFWNIQERTNATLLNLSICYRCPRSVVELAQSIVPEIEAAPNAPEGTVRWVKESKLAETLKAGDFVLCRLTAPLVSLCLELIGRGQGAKVRGKDIGQQIIAIVRKVEELPMYHVWGDFSECLSIYEGTTKAKLSTREDAESAITSLEDKCNAVRACYEGMDATNIDDLCDRITELFADTSERGCVILSTVHRAKGLEFERVHILKPGKLPLTWPKQTPEEAQQEYNLEYVAYTRAMSELVFVEED